MDYTHKIIDAIDDGTMRLVVPEKSKIAGEIGDNPAYWTELAKIKKALEFAHKFDVSQIDEYFNEGTVPELAWEALENNLLPLPFDIFVINFGKSEISGLTGDEGAQVNGSKASMSLLVIAENNGFTIQMFVELPGFGWTFAPFVTCVEAGVKREAACRWRSRAFLASAFPDETEERVMDNAASHVVQTLLLMETKDVAHSVVKAPEKLNKARRKRGKSALHDYSVVSICVGRSIKDRNIPNGFHASPRLHWRRGHVRIISSGRAVLVRPCLVGDPGLGMVEHDYSVRAKRQS